MRPGVSCVAKESGLEISCKWKQRLRGKSLESGKNSLECWSKGPKDRAPGLRDGLREGRAVGSQEQTGLKGVGEASWPC